MARILVIDDSPIIRGLLVDFLTEEGHQVVATDDPVKGTEMALNDEWAVVICDTHMPGKNGYEVFADVVAKKPGLSFLITDSLPEDMALVYDRIDGNYHYLRKPFELDQIRLIIESCLQSSETK